MYEDTILRLQIFDKTKTLCFVEESDYARSDEISGIKFACLGCADLHILGSYYPFNITWIRRLGRKVAIFIDISHHFFEGLPLGGFCLALFHLLLLILALLHLFLVSF